MQLEPPNLDPTSGAAAAIDEVTYANIFEGLTRFASDGSVIPDLAESWDISEDGLTYTFHLREGLGWSNGEPLVAAHFVAGMRRLVNPATGAFYAQMLMDLENAAGIVSGDIPVSMLGVEAPDASWGTLVDDGRRSMAVYPWLLIFPAGFLAMTIFSLNALGDGLRDALDPQARRER